MAQAVFQDHPIGEYLRDVGETRELMPGTSSELEAEIDLSRNAYPVDENDSEAPAEWRPRLLVELLETLHSILELVRPPESPNPFVERFKYDIISSSLLSPMLQTQHHRPVRTPPIPGKLKLHSRNSSADVTSLPPPAPNTTPPEPSYITPSLVVVAVAFFYLTGHTLLALISSAAVASSLHSLYVMNDSSKIDMTPCLISLNELIAASDAWASVVQDAISSIEVEEQSLLYGVTFTPSSPTPSIRVALHSSVLTTQNQFDNVRQLFSALTSATELSQLSEMYAPTSNKSNYSLPDTNARPLSLPTSQSQSRLRDSKLNKRSTWNGSYTSLANQVGPLPHFLRRREKRRSNMSSLLQDTLAKKTQSVPVALFDGPSGCVSSKFASVCREIDSDGGQSTDAESFSATALALHKSLKAEAAEVFRPSSSDPSSSQGRCWMPFTISSGSPLKYSRHPLSLPTIQNAVQSALASRRYACAHLLALRFSEEEDEGYWEDVRSVMALLTTTLSDASSRLMQALEDHEKSKLRDQSLAPLSEVDDGFPDQHRDRVSDASSLREPTRFSETTFAPLPGPLARFAAHVTAISSALEDAKEHLEHCVTSLKDEHSDESVTPSSRRRSSVPSQTYTTNLCNQHPALQAYERLRQELGLALRECERGRERLLEIVKPPVEPAGHDSDSDDVPTLSHDVSDDSDKLGPHSLSDGEEGDVAVNRAALVAFLDSKVGGEGGFGMDDASEHLLLSASPQHLPPALGIEQVFEAETAPTGSFTRERPKLTREERIKLMKARRGGVTFGRCQDSAPDEFSGDREGGEKWGPGGEVVQELKDVIWKVGERRRKFAGGAYTWSADLRVKSPLAVEADRRRSDDVGEVFISTCLEGDKG